MFQSYEAEFEKHGVLRAQSLNDGMNGPVRIVEQLFAGYSDGIPVRRRFHQYDNTNVRSSHRGIRSGKGAISEMVQMGLEIHLVDDNTRGLVAYSNSDDEP